MRTLTLKEAEGDRGVAAARDLIAFVALVGACTAQYSGSWGTPFNHQVSTASLPNTNATDPGSPFGGLDAMTFYSFGTTLICWPGYLCNREHG